MPFPKDKLAAWTRKQKIAGEARRKHIADCLARGILNQFAILEYLAEFDIRVSQKTICQDIKKIRQEWREQRLDTIEAMVDREDRRLDVVVREAWAAWERSKEESRIRRTKLQNPGRQGDQVHGGPQVMERELTVKGRDGEPAFLQIVLGAMASRRAMLGLDYKDRKNLPGTQVNIQVNNNLPKIGAAQTISLDEFKALPLAEMHQKIQEIMSEESRGVNNGAAN